VSVEEFEQFVRARTGALIRTAYLLTGDRHLAEDLVQETLARVAERWSTVVQAGNVEAYVRRVLYHRTVDRWRRRRARVSERLDIAPDAGLSQPGDDAETVVRRVVLRDALARLTPRQRAVLVLRFYEDYTEAQTADLLGCSVNTVKSQTRHALVRLRALVPDLAEAFAPRPFLEVTWQST
jgi:RNA polymerase sigma-70 factor (sigma-E family)